MSTQNNSLSNLDLFVNEAEALYLRQTSIGADITQALSTATLTAAQIDEYREKLGKFLPTRNWNTDTWIGKYWDIKYTFSRLASAMYQMHGHNLEIEMEVEAESDSGTELVTVFVPVEFYLPQGPGIQSPYRRDLYKSLNAKEGINITPEMITLLVFDVSDESGIDDEGERYTYEVLDDVRLVLDHELLELALHDYLMQSAQFEGCTQLQFSLNNFATALSKDLMEALQEDEGFPSSSLTLPAAALWKFHFVNHYDKQIVDEMYQLMKNQGGI